MGVHGLWRLIEPSGKPVPLETLENKVLAVDVSIWLHQAVKGFQDSKGAPVPNAHLLGIYHRICKLLYFRIKPVFVFDGGVPVLKKQTIAKRNQSKQKNVSEANKIQRQLLTTLLKHTAVSKVLTEQIEASIGIVSKTTIRKDRDDMYVLPPGSELDSTISSSEDESYSETTTDSSSPTKSWDLHSIDMNSRHFKSLPVDVRHDILTDLKETRKQNSWGRLHELPKISDDFSVFQMKRLLKRQAVQEALEAAEKEMGGKSLSLAELESILKDQGVIKNQNLGSRIASDETKKYLLVKDVQKAMEDAKKYDLTIENQLNYQENEQIIETKEEILKNEETLEKSKADQEYEEDLKRAISLSLESEPSTSDAGPSTSTKETKQKTHKPEFLFLENFEDADFASSSSDEEIMEMRLADLKMSSAKSYMMEYSGLTPNEVAKIIKTNSSKGSKKVKLSKLTATEENIRPKEAMSEKNKAENESIVENKLDIKMKENKDKSVDCSKKKKTVDPIKIGVEVDDVEIMSNSDSSDTEVGKDKKMVIDIVVNPNEQFDMEDDLFHDIFVQENKNSLPEHVNITNRDTTHSKPTPLAIYVSDESKLEIIGDKTDEENVINSKNNFEKSIDTCKKEESKNCEKKSKPTETTKIKDNGQKDIIICDTKKSIEVSVHAEREIKMNNKSPEINVSEKDLVKLKNKLQQQKVELLTEKSTKERMAGNITDQMYQEAQDLLELFGVPYIIAPMEAEAQCAFLDEIELTDGTITDDSDIWLFGGKTVYKNFFNQSKYVLEFRAENINHHFKLSREQMILLALLVGSDYTAGLQGIGPVTAMEILAAFPPAKVNEFNVSQLKLLSGLREFRSWFNKGKSPGPGRTALKSKLKNVIFTENFPSLQVVEAYLEPRVESSREPFSWGKPNSLALIEFAREKFGWTKMKTEEILNPVLKRLEESRIQRSIKDYFKTSFKAYSGDAERKMSKRIKSAVTNMGRDPSEIVTEELEEELKSKPKKRTQKKANKPKEITETSECSRKKAEAKEANTAKKRRLKQKPTSDKISDSEENIKTNRIPKTSVSEEVAPKNPKSKASKNSEDQSEEIECKNSDEINEKIDHIRHRRKLQEALVEKRKTKVGKDPETKIKISKVQSVSENLQAIKKLNIQHTKTEPEESIEISAKIDHIRKRRKLKEAKVAVASKKTKLSKERTKTEQNPEASKKLIPEGLEQDEEVNLLSQVVQHSSQKVKEITKSLQDQIESFQAGLSTPKSARPTVVFRKEVIPQIQKDKTALLRNKLKAIEVFRKGKQGPGYVPKRDRKRRPTKEDAALSENSSEDC